jgi:hypothetical protein
MCTPSKGLTMIVNQSCLAHVSAAGWVIKVNATIFFHILSGRWRFKES